MSRVPGQKVRPPLLSSHEPREPEAVLTGHADVNHHMFIERKDDTLNAPDSQKAAMFPYGDEDGIHQIREGAALFNWPELKTVNRLTTPKIQNPNKHGEECWASLNGVSLAPYGNNHLNASACLNFLGRSKSVADTYPGDDGTSTNAGLAYEASGGTSMIAPAPYPGLFVPKEKIVPFVPPLESADKYTQSALRLTSGANQNQITPCRRTNSSGICQMVQDLAHFRSEVETDQASGGRVCEHLMGEKKYTKDTMRRAILGIGMAGIRVLLDRNIISLNVVQPRRAGGTTKAWRSRCNKRDRISRDED